MYKIVDNYLYPEESIYYFRNMMFYIYGSYKDWGSFYTLLDDTIICGKITFGKYTASFFNNHLGHDGVCIFKYNNPGVSYFTTHDELTPFYKSAPVTDMLTKEVKKAIFDYKTKNHKEEIAMDFIKDRLTKVGWGE